jgi:hypothetical protein
VTHSENPPLANGDGFGGGGGTCSYGGARGEDRYVVRVHKITHTHIHSIYTVAIREIETMFFDPA